MKIIRYNEHICYIKNKIWKSIELIFVSGVDLNFKIGLQFICIFAYIVETT